MFQCSTQSPTAVFFDMDSGEGTRPTAPVGCSKGAPSARRALFCMPMPPVIKRVRHDFEAWGVEALAYFDISIGMTGITPNSVAGVLFLLHDLCEIGIATNPSKPPVALPPKGYMRTPEYCPSGRHRRWQCGGMWRGTG